MLTSRTCGLDETCVLCQFCYNPADHEGHQVTIQISQRDCGGVCDCGDPEAWRTELHCRYQNSTAAKNTSSEIPQELLRSIEQTVDIALDYAIDVLSNAELAVQKYKHADQVLRNERDSELSEEKYGVPDTATNAKYTLSLWNDQKHSFTDAMEVIKDVTKKKIEFAKMVTVHIDSYGRGILTVSPDLRALMQKKARIEATGFAVTVRSTKDYFREEMCAAIFSWLEDLYKSPLNGNYTVLRDTICASLLKPWNYGRKRLVALHWNSNQFDADDSLLDPIVARSNLNGPFIPDIDRRPASLSRMHEMSDGEAEGDVDAAYEGSFGIRGVPTLPPAPTATTNLPDLFQSVEGSRASRYLGAALAERRGGNENLTSSFWNTTHGQVSDTVSVNIRPRIQYLIFFDVRLWKNLRLTLRDLYISAVVANPDSKVPFGHYYAQLYPQIAELYVLSDREPECSIITGLSTQLFTTPSIATDLMRYDYMTRFLAALYTFFTRGEFGSPRMVDPSGFIDLESNNKIIGNRRFGQIFHDLEYTLNRNTDHELVATNTDIFKQVAEFILLFQGVLPLKREVHSHVEYESETWIYLFNTLPYVLQLAQNIAVNLEASGPSPVAADVADMVVKWAQGLYASRFQSPEVPEPSKYRVEFFDVTRRYGGREITASNVIQYRTDSLPVSLHHPLHALLAWIVEYSKPKTVEDLRAMLNLGDDASKYALLFDFPLRTLGVLSQIQVGLWVRNGYSVRSQLHHYREITFRDNAFARDVFMAQTALATMDPATVFLHLQNRWLLLDEDWQTSETFDESQRMYLIEEFLHHLIFFVMERTNLRGLSDQEVKNEFIAKEIIQCLSFRDRPFSDICHAVPTSITTGDSFDLFERMLRDIAVYKPPSGVRDSGIYQLKPEYYSKFDTHYIHFSSAKIEEAVTAIKQKLHKSTGKPIESIVPEPPLVPISEGPFAGISLFTLSVPFADFVSNLLQFIRDNKSSDTQLDTVFSHILQLIHVAALDDLSRATPGNADGLFSSLAELLCAAKDGQNPETSILKAICTLVDSREFSDHRAKVQRIVDLLRQKMHDSVNEHLEQIQSSFSQAMKKEVCESTSDDGNETEADKKKRMAKERQAKILAEFQNQQKQFAQQNLADFMDVDDGEDIDDDEDGAEWTFPEPECILCRVPGDKSTVYGQMGHVLQSNVIREVPWEDPDWVYEAFGSNSDMDRAIPMDAIDKEGSSEWQKYRKEYLEKNKWGPGFPPEHVMRYKAITGCCHIVHYHCFEDYLNTTRSRAQQLTRNNPEDAGRGEFLCPLCRAINNCFLPIIWKSNSLTAEAYLTDGKSTDEEEDAGPSRPGDLYGDKRLKLSDHSTRLFEEGTKHLMPVFESTFTNPRDISRPELQKIFSSLIERAGGDFKSLVTVFANSVSTLEISLRGKAHTSPFGGIVVDQVPSQTLQTLRITAELLRAIPAFNGDQLISSSDLPSKLSPLLGFEEFVYTQVFVAPSMNLKRHSILREYIKASVMNFLETVIIHARMRVKYICSDVFKHLPSFEPAAEDKEAVLRAFYTLIQALGKDLTPEMAEFFGNRETLTVVYSMLVKATLPILRKVSIFVHSMSGAYDALDYSGNMGAREVDRLCEFLRLPSFDELLMQLAVDSESISHFSELPLVPQNEYPGVVRLLRLPERLDEFLNFANIKDIDLSTLPADPAVCLFCGANVSLQSPLYDEDTREGPCTTHMRRCANDTGIFLLPRRNYLLLKKGIRQGSFIEGPYLDLHGEPDELMRYVELAMHATRDTEY